MVAVIMSMQQCWNDDEQGKTKELGEKSVPMPVHQPCISLEITHD
jgi:hypothetical protein